MDDDITSFEELRPLLFSIAYRMLSSVADAEDAVQEAFLKWQDVDRSKVESAKAYLAKAVTRLCIDRLRSAQHRRETYVGPWLPEPLIDEAVPDAAEAAERADTLSMAFLVVLESLSPLERAAFLLREVFRYEYGELGDILGRTEDACRQLVHRAKQNVAARRPRFDVDRRQQQELLRSFTTACAQGDLDDLLSLLTEDVVLKSDGGGRVRAARRPIVGRDKVARFLLGILRKAPEEAAMRVVTVNGQPGLAVYEDDRISTVVTLDVADGRIQGIHIVVNPDKLRAAT
jgi:RNA polymerase sigma-70 factor (ECF subfamily)